MAILFTDADSDGYEHGAAIIANEPWTIMATFRPTSTAAGAGDYTLAGLGDAASFNNGAVLRLSGGNLSYRTRNGTYTSTVTSLSADTWYLGGLSATSSSSQQLYLNGATEDSAGNAGGIGTPNRTNVGIWRLTSSLFDGFDGDIADVGYWDVSLTTNEHAMANAGVPFGMIRPASLVEWYSLHTTSYLSGLGANQSNLTTTLGSPADTGEHWPKFWLPQPIIIAREPAAVAGATPKGPLGHPLHGALGGPV